jgi:hypothetical protein
MARNRRRSQRRSRGSAVEFPFGLRLIFGGIALFICGSAFGKLPIPPLQSLMGLAVFVGFWMGVGGVLLLVAPLLIPRIRKIMEARQFPQPGSSLSPGATGMLNVEALRKEVEGCFPTPTAAPPPAPKPEWSISLLRSLDWKVFEDLCVGFFRELGLRAEPTPLGADGGVDIWLFPGGEGGGVMGQTRQGRMRSG